MIETLKQRVAEFSLFLEKARRGEGPLPLPPTEIEALECDLENYKAELRELERAEREMAQMYSYGEMLQASGVESGV